MSAIPIPSPSEIQEQDYLLEGLVHEDFKVYKRQDYSALRAEHTTDGRGEEAVSILVFLIF